MVQATRAPVLVALPDPWFPTNLDFPSNRVRDFLLQLINKNVHFCMLENDKRCTLDHNLLYYKELSWLQLSHSCSLLHPTKQGFFTEMEKGHCLLTVKSATEGKSRPWQSELGYGLCRTIPLFIGQICACPHDPYMYLSSSMPNPKRMWVYDDYHLGWFTRTRIRHHQMQYVTISLACTHLLAESLLQLLW